MIRVTNSGFTWRFPVLCNVSVSGGFVTVSILVLPGAGFLRYPDIYCVTDKNGPLYVKLLSTEPQPYRLCWILCVLRFSPPEAMLRISP